jgi:hypothetical protein
MYSVYEDLPTFSPAVECFVCRGVDGRPPRFAIEAVPDSADEVSFIACWSVIVCRTVIGFMCKPHEPVKVSVAVVLFAFHARHIRSIRKLVGSRRMMLLLVRSDDAPIGISPYLVLGFCFPRYTLHDHCC